MKFGSPKLVTKTGAYRIVPRFALLPFSPWADVKFLTDQTVWLQNYFVVQKYSYSSMDGSYWADEAPFVSRALAEQFILSKQPAKKSERAKP